MEKDNLEPLNYYVKLKDNEVVALGQSAFKNSKWRVNIGDTVVPDYRRVHKVGDYVFVLDCDIIGKIDERLEIDEGDLQ